MDHRRGCKQTAAAGGSIAAPTKREVNRSLCTNAGTTLGSAIPFFCECSDPRCHHAVWLTLDEYERASEYDDWAALTAGCHRLKCTNDERDLVEIGLVSSEEARQLHGIESGTSLTTGGAQ